MQSQIRTIGLENENAEIELATVSSFCDSAESTLNRSVKTLTAYFKSWKNIDIYISLLSFMSLLSSKLNLNRKIMRFKIFHLK